MKDRIMKRWDEWEKLFTSGSKEDWPLTLKGIDEVSSPDNIEMVVYTYGDIGFKPGAVSATMFTSNLKTKDN